MAGYGWRLAAGSDQTWDEATLFVLASGCADVRAQARSPARRRERQPRAHPQRGDVLGCDDRHVDPGGDPIRGREAPVITPLGGASVLVTGGTEMPAGRGSAGGSQDTVGVVGGDLGLRDQVVHPAARHARGTGRPHGHRPPGWTRPPGGRLSARGHEPHLGRAVHPGRRATRTLNPEDPHAIPATEHRS